jgi:hypothetical protein
MAPLTNAFQESMRGIRAGGSAVWTKLRDLVAPREAAKSVTKDKQGPLTNSSSEKDINEGMSQIEKQTDRQAVNSYTAHA